MNATTTIEHPIENAPDPVARVREIGRTQEWADWHISQNLTDRWGDINRYQEADKPLAALDANPELLNHLRLQMWEEETFVVRKDGKYGILFEIEFCSSESEEMEADMDAAWFKSLRPHAQVVEHLLKSMAKIAPEYPGVQFAVPEEKWIVNNRPAAWAFVPDGQLDEQQRETLGKALLAL